MTKNKSILHEILIYFIIPVVIVFLFNIVIDVFYSSEIRKSTVEQYDKTLNIISNSVNQWLFQSLTTSNLLSLNQETENMMLRPDSSENRARDYLIIETLMKFKNISEFISSVTIVDRVNGRVAFESGSTSMSFYFRESNAYEDYPIETWENMEISNVGYEVLAPTKKFGKTVIPVVTNGFLGIKSKNLLIIDIDCKAISDAFLEAGLPGEGSLYIFDPVINKAIGSSGEIGEDMPFSNPDFVNLLHDNQSFNYKFKGENYLVVRTIDTYGVFSRFKCIAITPMKSLFMSFNTKRLIINAISILVIFLVALFVYRLGKNLYKPIRNMRDRLINIKNDGEPILKNEFSFINKQLQNIIDINRNMKYQLQSVQPLVCEQYILKLLETKNDIIDSEVDDFLNKNGMYFNQDYFTVVSIRFRYTEKFFLEFNNSQYMEINSDLANFFRILLASDYTTFLISPRQDNLLLIINTCEDSKSFDSIIKVLTETVKAFEADRELLTVSIGMGNTYSGYEGMRCSYEESRNVSILLRSSEHSGITIYSGKKSLVTQYNYSIDDENNVFNCMMKGNIDETKLAIKQILEKNINDGVNNLGIKFLYQQIYNTAVKVIQAKKITEEYLMQDNYININMVIDMIDNEQFIEYLEKVILETVSHSRISTTRLDMTAIINYITENCNKNIYLETVAEHFNTSPKYLARQIKKHIGISYGEYLARLKIEKAKEYLSETNLTINEIIEKSGFNSRNTFIRTFKKLVGVSPSDYRKTSP